MDARAFVEEQVRRSVRDRGVDPLADPDAVRAFVDDAIAAYVTERTDGTPADQTQVLTAADVDTITRDVNHAVAGFGPLQQYLDDDSIEEIWLNEPGRVFVARNGRSELTPTLLDTKQVVEIVERMLSVSGRRLDLSQPFVDASLVDGSRLHVVIPDITRRHWAVNIRKYIVRAHSVRDLVALQTMTPQVAQFLEASVVSGLNIVVAGGTQAGKTTLLNALLGAVPARERIVTCEETFELQVHGHPDWVAMQTRQSGLEGTGEVSLRDLVREALRMRPTRLVVGEVRQQEALDLLIALNSGMPAMASIHANSAREAVTKLTTLPLLAGSNITADFVSPTVASCVDLIVHIGTDSDGTRRVREVAGLSGRVEQGVVELSSIFDRTRGTLERSDGFPPRRERFAAAGFDLTSLLGHSDFQAA